LQLGDLIVQFDGKPTLTPDEFARQIQNVKPRSKVKIKFYRGGTEQTLELTLGHGW
jgi:S1-C subfamily serine protease